MIDVLFASNNKGKYDELVKDLREKGINLIYDGKLTLKEQEETLIRKLKGEGNSSL